MYVNKICYKIKESPEILAHKTIMTAFMNYILI